MRSFDMLVVVVVAVVVTFPTLSLGFLSLPSTRVARLADGLIKRSFSLSVSEVLVGPSIPPVR